MTLENGKNKLFPILEYINEQPWECEGKTRYKQVILTKEDILNICDIKEPENQTPKQRGTYYTLAGYAGRIRNMVRNSNNEYIVDVHSNNEYIVDVHSRWERKRDNTIELVEYVPNEGFITLESRTFYQNDIKDNYMIPKGGYITITRLEKWD